MSDALNFRGVPEFSADALHGPGVFETLRAVAHSVLQRLGSGAPAGPVATSPGRARSEAGAAR